MNTSPVVAQTILRQIGSWNLAAIGARNFVYGDAMIQMDVNTRGQKVRVELDPSDTYTVIYGKVQKYEWHELDRQTFVYCDQLGKIVYSMTQK